MARRTPISYSQKCLIKRFGAIEIILRSTGEGERPTFLIYRISKPPFVLRDGGIAYYTENKVSMTVVVRADLRIRG